MKPTTQQLDNLKQVAGQAKRHLSQISEETDDLTVYLVGGAIRDALLGEPVNDLDFVVTGETAESMLDRGFENIEASSYGVLHDETHAEFALARTETKPDDEYGYKSIETHTDGVKIDEDLARRDLTINAMAIKLTHGRPKRIKHDKTESLRPDGWGEVVFIDLFDGLDDLNSGTIRHVSEAFNEDPIRVMRAARYAARFETSPNATVDDVSNLLTSTPFTVDEETKRLMGTVAPELNRMSRERVGMEVIKAMKQAKNPERFWGVLRDTGALAVLAPKLDRGMIVPSGRDKHHSEGNVYKHSMLVMQEMHKYCENEDITGIDRVRRLMMAVVHDLGKVISADDQGGLWSSEPPESFPGHAKMGKSAAKSMGETLGLPVHITNAMSDGCEYHMKIHDLPWWDPHKAIEFIEDHDPEPDVDTPYMATIEELIDLARADHQGRFQHLKVFDSEDEYQMHEDAPEGTAQPIFDADRYLSYIENVRTVIKEVDGCEILRRGTCEEHSTETIENEELAETLSSCEDCRTPGEWVGDKLQNERRKRMTNPN